MPMVRRYSVFAPQQQGSQWLWQGREISTASGQDVKINFTQNAHRTAIMDVDGDGLVDVVYASATEYQTFFALGRYPGGDGQLGHARWIGSDTAEISNDPVTTCTPWSAAAVRLGDPDVRVGDLNGDGLPDIVRVRSGQVLYWPGRGNGFWGTGERDGCPAGSFGQGQHIQMVNAPNFGTVQPGRLHLGDVNGDGLADLIEVRANAVDVYLNDPVFDGRQREFRGDTSGWLWRPTERFVTGSVRTAERHRTRREYDVHGDMTSSFATLSGTLPLDRFHESSATVAPAPPNASGGIASPIEIETATLEHDDFGNVVESRGPHGHCSSMELRW